MVEFGCMVCLDEKHMYLFTPEVNNVVIVIVVRSVSLGRLAPV